MSTPHNYPTGSVTLAGTVIVAWLLDSAGLAPPPEVVAAVATVLGYCARALPQPPSHL